MQQLIEIFPHLSLGEKAAYLFWGFCVIAFYATLSYAVVLSFYYSIRYQIKTRVRG